MFRKHFNAATAVAVVALVFAMAGGAYAAGKYLITSTKQISPKVLASLKGKTGKAGKDGANGAQGPAGAAGLQGPAGAKGENGAPGANGTNGNDGVSVASSTEPKGANCKEGGSKFVAASGTTYACNGEKGKEGSFGGSPLPTGKSLTGVYGGSTFSEAAFPNAGFGIARVGVGFAEPVAEESTIVYVKEGETPPAECPGSLAEPKASEGFLCIFGQEVNAKVTSGTVHTVGTASSTIGFTIEGLGAGKGGVLISGTWAVTSK